MIFPLRFATSWQRCFCQTCREETNHHKNICVHCGAHLTGGIVPRAPHFNGRESVGRLTDEQRSEARRLFSAGVAPRLIASKLHVSPGTIYRLNPMTRG